MKTTLFCFFRKPYEVVYPRIDVRISSEGSRHAAGDDFFIFFQVCNGSEGKAPIGDLVV